MYCPTCGSDVGNSKFCPACGCKLASELKNNPHNSRKIILKRPSAYGGAYTFNVLLDGCFIDTLKAKQTLTIDADNYEHTVQIDSNGHGSSYPIAIKSGDADLSFDVDYSATKGILITQTSGPSAGPTSKKSGGCYVATAVYGSYDCPQVWMLRRYRDDTLAATWYGRAFIRAYYAVSPTVVKWFGQTAWFNRMWKGRLDRMVEQLKTNGVKDTPYEDKDWR